MPLKKETHTLQSELARYCRTGDIPVLEGARQDRLFHYRRLIKNVVTDVLVSAYPITLNTLGEDVFEALIADFFKNHDPANPQYWRMPEELIEFVADRKYAERLNKPFLEELLYFEWLEIEVHTMEDVEELTFEDGNLLSDIPVLNPYHFLVHFNYPVHRNPLAEKKGHYFLLIYRDMESGAVRFMELSPFMAVLVEKLNDGYTGLEAVRLTAELLGVDIKDATEQSGETLNSLKSKDVLLGTKRFR